MWINIIIIIIIIVTYPLTTRVVGAPQEISQPDSSIFPCSPLPSALSDVCGYMKIIWLNREIFLVIFDLQLRIEISYKIEEAQVFNMLFFFLLSSERLGIQSDYYYYHHYY